MRRRKRLRFSSGRGSQSGTDREPSNPPRLRGRDGRRGWAERSSRRARSGHARLPTTRRPGGKAARLTGGAAARLGSWHRTAIRRRHRSGRPHHASGPRRLCRLPLGRSAGRRVAGGRRGATASKRCRSSACAGRLPSICRNRSGRSRISPISRRSMSRRLEELRGAAQRDLSRARASDLAAVPDPRAGQCRRGAPAGQRPLSTMRPACCIAMRAVHVGIATQTEDGLLVPVMRHAEALDLWQSAAELRRLAAAARAGKASRDELTGSTITITSLGALGGLAATPVINYPEVAIIGVNRIAERPVVRHGPDRDPQDDEPVLVVRSPHRRRLGGGLVHPAHQAPARTPGDAVHRTRHARNPAPARSRRWRRTRRLCRRDPRRPARPRHRAGRRRAARRHLPVARLHPVEGADPCRRQIFRYRRRGGSTAMRSASRSTRRRVSTSPARSRGRTASSIA